jgi:EAL domain-containing protein (putative c-di-GMP-specific phosphodiesterase class I)
VTVHAALCYTIAEGIETKGDSEKINHIGIYLHQGWYHGRPMSAEKITAYTVQC